ELFADQRAAQLAHGLLPDDADLLGLILLEALGFQGFDFLRAIVLGNSAPREHARVDHRTDHPRRDAQTGVAHLARLFAENRAQQLFFRGKLGLALGRDLADQDIARPHLRPDADDTAGVEALERFLADVGNVAGDFLGTELGITRDAFELLDMDRGKEVFLDHALGNEDRVIEVVTAPRHERDQHVAAEREFRQSGRGRLPQHAAGPDLRTLHPDGSLVDAGVLVGALVLDEVVDADPRIVRVLGLLLGAPHDPFRIHALHGSVATRD